MNRTTNLIVAASLSAALLAAACGDDTSTTAGDQPATDGPSVSITNVAVDRDTLDSATDAIISLPDGWFEMAGYGTVLRVDGNDITSHYVTASTCVTADTFDNELPVDHADDDGGVITVDLVGPTTDYRLLPLAGPLACDSDEADTLTALDEVFTTHYPFFEQRDFDWPNAMAEVRTAVAGGGPVEEVFAELLVELGDGHTTFEGLDIDPDFDAFDLPGITTLDELETALGAEFDRVLASVDDITADETGSVAWGRLDGDTGYLIMVAFEGISGEEGDPVADLAALRAALDQAIADLGDVDRLVVDMRFNVGGYEDLAAVAAGYFVDEPTPAYRKWAYAQPEPFVQTIVIEPEAVFFDGRVAVVTSPITASAAEAFTLAMTEVADAAVIGNPSFGEFSDAIDWTLPNGTEFTLSMENYTDLAGTNHEATGIPVDVPAPFDQAIDAAVDQLAAP